MEVRPASGPELERWDDVVAASPAATLFHRLDWLRAVEEGYGTRLVPLVASAGGETVGLFPLFERRRYGVRLLASPPPRTLAPVMGPVLAGPDASERGWLEFLDAAFAHVARGGATTLFKAKAELPAGGARAAAWNGFRVSPAYTYVLSLETGVEEVLAGFQPRARRSVRDAARLGLALCASPALEDAVRVHELISERYREQGMRPPFARRYLEALWRRMGGRELFALCLERDGRFVTGMIAAVWGGTVSCLSGAPRMEVERVSINELLHAESLRWAHGLGARCYDLVGANTRPLIAFKAKLRPELREMFVVESDTLAGWIARGVYRKLLR